MAFDINSDSGAALKFIVDLSNANQVYGLSTTDSWNRIINLARNLYWNLRFIATPNHVQLIFWQDNDDTQYVRFITRPSGNYDLEKMAEIRKLMVLVEVRQINIRDAITRLKEIINAPDKYSQRMTAFAYVLCGSGFAGILCGSWLDVFFGGLLSLISFYTAFLANRFKEYAILMETVAAMFCAIAASALAGLISGIHPMAVTVCAIIFFVPGFGLTIAPNELVSGNTLSGLVWFTNACVTMVKLLFGGIVGFDIAQNLLPASLPELGQGLSPLWSWLFVPILVSGLAILFRVPRRNLIWPILGAWVVWTGMQAGNLLGDWQGTFLGSMALILFANICFALFHVAGNSIILPGIMVLVPGVATLRALYTAQTQGLMAGFQPGYTVVTLISAIMAGVIVGNAMISSARSSRFYYLRRFRKKPLA